jgi:hypothetical protein
MLLGGGEPFDAKEDEEVQDEEGRKLDQHWSYWKG